MDTCPAAAGGGGGDDGGGSSCILLTSNGRMRTCKCECCVLAQAEAAGDVN
jgi:hypothetical protein